MRSSPSWQVLGLGVAAAAAATAIALRMKKNSGAKLAPALDVEQTREIIKTLAASLQATCGKFSNAAEKIKMQMAQQGQQLEDQQIMQHFIYPHFKTALQELEQKICDDFDIAEYELEEAVTEYCEDEVISQHVKAIKKLIMKYGGQVESDEVEMAGAGAGGAGGAGAGGEVDLQSVMELFNDLMKRVLDATEEYAAQHVQLHGPPADPTAVQEFQEGMVQLHTAIQNAVLAEYGLTEELFQQILMKHSSSQEVQGAFMQMQFGIQQKLAMAGIGAGMG